jgi:signal transduction histidine kinase/ActR/RegA family two-component response regulator
VLGPVVTQRNIAQVFLGVQAILTALLAIVLLSQHDPNALGATVVTILYVAGFVAFRCGLEQVRHVVVVSLTGLLLLAAREPYLSQRPMLAVVLPPIVALMLTSPAWIVGSALLGLAGLSLRTNFQTPLQPLDLAVFTMVISGLVLARRSVDVATAHLVSQTQSAEAASSQAEAAARQAIAERDRVGKLETELLHLQRLESVGRLAGGVAHEFNNSLTVISASASMAERALATGGSPADELHEVHLAVSRASTLTKQLLAFARKQSLVKRGVEVGELVSNVERVLRRLIGEETKLTVKLAGEPLRVFADAGQLEQVLVNLVINARDAIKGNGEIQITSGRVSVKPGPETDRIGLSGGDYAFIEVKDSGVGMTNDVQARLFEPFFTTKAQGRGTGLGLATSFGIVRQHEGSIRVESEPGKGTSMRVLLPLSAGFGAAPATSGMVPIASASKRVLVVEDEPQVRAIAARALASVGFEVLQATNGASALQLFREQTTPLDVIVTDVVMPQLSGPELARAVRKLCPQIGLVFMSGFPESMQDSRADEFDDAAFLSKPFSPQELIDAVRQRIEHRESERMALETKCSASE